MAEIGYFGTYARFSTDDKEEAAQFLTSNNVVGHPFTITSTYEQGERSTWIVNPFGQNMGRLDNALGEQVDVLDARGWTTVALLSFVAFSQEPAPGEYWGEVAIISYDPANAAAFEGFVREVGSMMAQGIRPSLNLGQESLRSIVAANGKWKPTGREPLPELGKGEAFVKTEKLAEEHIVDVARRHPKGCSVLSIIFMAALAVAIIFAVVSCMS